MATYDFVEYPEGELYRRLLKCAQSFCTQLSIVLRDGIPLEDAACLVVDALDTQLIERRATDSWPGTILHDSEAEVRRYQFDEFTYQVIVESSASLFDWVQPHLPEDPCLYRPDGSTWLVTIAHEEDAYLELAPSELAALNRLVPDLRIALRSG